MMKPEETPPEKNIFIQYWEIFVLYWRGNAKKEAWLLLCIVLLFILLLTAGETYGTYLLRWVMNSLQERNATEFYKLMLVAAGVFVVTTFINTFHLYSWTRLSIYWRKWLNFYLLDRYFMNDNYYKMSLYSDIDNPDQRIASDLLDYMNFSTNNFGDKLILSIISLATFTVVLWMISYKLVFFVVLYAAIVTGIIFFVVRELVRVNFRNIKVQADYRYSLIHVRDNIESIAFYQGEKNEKKRLYAVYYKLFEILRRLIALQRNIDLIQFAYMLYSIMPPYLILAPQFFSGKIEIGVITQAIAIFAIMIRSLSIVIQNFKTLSTFGAVIRRLYSLIKAFDAKEPPGSNIRTKQDGQFILNDVTVKTPDQSMTLIENLSLTIKPGNTTIIMGESGCGKSSLLRTIAGLWDSGSGEITRPDIKNIMFSPQRPYMILGTLREQLTYPNQKDMFTDDALQQALITANLPDLLERVGGLDVQLPWSDVLSLGEQQKISFARVFLAKPQYAILDESTSAIDEPSEAILYERLREFNITYVSVAHRSTLIRFHNNILKMYPDTSWELQPVDSNT